LLVWFLKPQFLSSFSDYIANTTQTLISSDSAVMRPVSLSRDIARSADMSLLQGGLLQYKIEKGIYPASLSVLEPDFIAEVPTDPKTNDPYEYEQLRNGESYRLCMAFESQDKKGNSCFSPH
ncbi:MAG: hypothetical protein NUV98_04615, partial [Candidatus Roizmanbacteria bacterium]|nr:hypothetical protein [Candidatus Roizmanbacteria bacterium]